MNAREHRAPFYRSIRFRLTIWYGGALIIVILAMSAALHTLLVRSLNRDAEDRLTRAAAEITQSITAYAPDGRDGVATEIDPASLVLPAPSYDAILLSGLWYQVYNYNLQPAVVADNSRGPLLTIPDDLQKELAQPGVFKPATQTLLNVNVSGRRSLVLVAPISIKLADGQIGPQVGWVVVGEPIGTREQTIAVVDSILRLVGAIGVILAASGGWVMAGRALAPLGRITNAAESIAHNDGAIALSQRLDIPTSGDELSQLAVTFNRMLDRIESAFDMQRRFVGDASHELRTPLTSVRGNVDVLLRQIQAGQRVERDELVEILSIVQRESSRMGRLIDDMLVLARSDGGGSVEFLKLEPVSLSSIARNAIKTAEQLTSGQRLVLETTESPLIVGDEDRLLQVMLILIDNAIRYTPAGGTISLQIDQAIDSKSGIPCARIIVRDTGTGIDAKHIPHLFERFYRAEGARSRPAGGTGLGLSIAMSIVHGHGGWIDVDSNPGAGAVFSVWLPQSGWENLPVANGENRPSRTLRSLRHGLPKRRHRPFSRHP